MIVLDVFLNKRKLCRAGVGSDGVLNGIVSWVKLTGEAARTARRLRKPDEEMRLHVGVFRDGTHRRWPNRRLKIGDTVTIAVGSAAKFDRPQVQKREDPTVPEAKNLKAGPGPTEQRIALKKHRETRFLNVDVDIWSQSP